LKEREAVNARLSCGMFGGESPPRRIMARSGQRTASTGRKPAGGKSATGKVAQKKTASRRSRPGDDVGIIPVLARAVREVANAAERG
jgi:hypothetical protein